MVGREGGEKGGTRGRLRFECVSLSFEAKEEGRLICWCMYSAVGAISGEREIAEKGEEIKKIYIVWGGEKDK